jgi:hypothetical protein
MGTVDAEQTHASSEMLCGWCGHIIGYSTARGSRGICESCYPRVIPTPDLTRAQVDKIPLGLLLINAVGRVLDYEHQRHKPIAGRNLFAEVVPFTLVRGLQGRFRDFLASGEAGQIFNLIFRVGQNKEINVQVFFGRICAEMAMVRIKVV